MSGFVNWSGVHRCRPAAIHQPHDEAQIARVLAQANADGLRAKVVGAGHSWSEAACTDGHLMNLDRMDAVLDVDHERAQVTVEAGLRLKDLNERLADEGLGMSNLGSISEQSVAGAIATGTHGTGLRFGNLSTMVRALRLMRADGQVQDITQDDGPLFDAARLSLGALGVVTRVTLQCERAFRLRELAVGMPLDDALEQLPYWLDRHEHVKLWWLPHTDRAMFYAFDRTDLPETVGPGTGGPLRDALEVALAQRWGRTEVDLKAEVDHWVNEHLFDAVLKAGARQPRLIALLNALIARLYFIDRQRIGRSDRIFNLAMPPVHREMEYGVPVEEAPGLIRDLRALIERQAMAVNFIVEVRYVAADNLMLSPAYGRDSCQLGAYMAQAPDLDAYFAAFEAMCLNVGGRPHWGKEFRAPSSELKRHLPRLDEFAALRQHLDPGKLFDNGFLRRIFAQHG